MNVLLKYRIETKYKFRSLIDQRIKTVLEQKPIWEYDDVHHKAFCHILLSIDNDFGDPEESAEKILHLLGDTNKYSFVYCGVVNLDLNEQSKISISKENNGKGIRIRQIIEVQEENRIKQYSFEVYFDLTDGSVTTRQKIIYI